MQRILILITFMISLLSQNKISVYLTESGTTIGEIEKEIVQNLFKLYNSRSSEKLDYELVSISSFSVFLKKINQIPFSQKDQVMALGQVTITDERKKSFSFSRAYIPSKEVLITLKENNSDFTLSTKRKVAAIKGTIHEKIMRSMEKQHAFKPILFLNFHNMQQALLRKDIDYMYGDNIDVWNDKKLKIAKVLKKQKGEGLGIVYHKDSMLNKRFESYLLYFLKSEKFKQLIRSYYGKDVSDYFMRSFRASSY